MFRKKKVIVWTTSVSDFLDGNVCGIGVQLYFWAQTFVKQGWRVTTFTHHKSFTKENIFFQQIFHLRKFQIINEWMLIMKVLLFERPELVISRGASRIVYPLSRICQLFGVKYIFFSASDVNFIKGRELISGGKHNRILFQKGVPLVSHIVVQNHYQQKTLLKHYGRESLVLPNIWGAVPMSVIHVEPIDVIWVANLRQLKRPEWVLNAAKKLPQYKFTIIGGPSSNNDYYNHIKQEAAKLNNFTFMGKQPFSATCRIVGQAKLLACTSEFEGFPNTFLQAWSKGLPVITTVNPNGVVSYNHLGMVVSSESEFQDALVTMLTNERLYCDCTTAIKTFFIEQYSSMTQIKKMLDYIGLS